MPKKDKTSRNLGNHAPHSRGPKTHRADVRVNRGETEEPEPEYSAKRGEDVDSAREKKLRDERPTRTKATGHNPDRRNR